MKKSLILLFFLFFYYSSSLFAQNFHSEIKNLVESREYQTAINKLQNFEDAEVKVFAINNYDYLLARMAEKQNETALAMMNYQKVVERNSVLSEYALWHLSQIARSSGNLLLERLYLRKLQTFLPDSLLSDAVEMRLTRSYFETDFDRRGEKFAISSMG